jgi:hypothetical protein
MPLCFRQGKRGLAGLTRAEQDHGRKLAEQFGESTLDQTRIHP